MEKSHYLVRHRSLKSFIGETLNFLNYEHHEDSQKTKIKNSPRLEYKVVNGRKIDTWRFKLGQKNGLYPLETPDHKHNMPSLYRFDDTIKTMCARLAQIRKLNQTEIEGVKKSKKADLLSPLLNNNPMNNFTLPGPEVTHMPPLRQRKVRLKGFKTPISRKMDLNSIDDLRSAFM